MVFRANQFCKWMWYIVLDKGCEPSCSDDSHGKMQQDRQDRAMHPACVCAYMHTLVIKALIHHLLLFNHVHQHVSLCINRRVFATTRFPRKARNSFLGIRNNSKHILKCLPNGGVVLHEILASKPERLWDSLHILSCFWLHPGVWQTIKKQNKNDKPNNNKNIRLKNVQFSPPGLIQRVVSFPFSTPSFPCVLCKHKGWQVVLIEGSNQQWTAAHFMQGLMERTCNPANLVENPQASFHIGSADQLIHPMDTLEVTKRQTCPLGAKHWTGAKLTNWVSKIIWIFLIQVPLTYGCKEIAVCTGIFHKLVQRVKKTRKQISLSKIFTISNLLNLN